MVAFADLFQLPTLAQAKANVLSIAQAAELKATSWILGSPSERWLEAWARVIDGFTSTVTTQAVRGFFLDLATDPGDPGDLSIDQTPRAGWFSALLLGWYGVVRRGQTYATTTVTIRNDGANVTLPFKAFDLTFTTVAPEPVKGDGGRPTYRNTEDVSIYTEIGSTITLASLASLTVPVKAEQLGSYGNASNDTLICQTQSFGTLTVTASGTALGEEREARADAILRGRRAAAKLSPGGPGAAYQFAANTALDGTPLAQHDGTGLVSITRIYVSESSANGTVVCYFADADGPAIAVDVESANANIEGVSRGVIVNPIGVVPDAVTYSGLAAVATPITVVGTAKIQSVPGVDDATLKTDAEAAIDDALELWFSTIPIGGMDQTLGAGVVYTSDLSGNARDAYAGLYAVNITTPAGSSTAITLGRVPTIAGSPPRVVVIVVAS